MPRYIEQLNECTNPAADDWLWIVDGSAPAADKDRKASVGAFALLAVANTFTANQAISKDTPELTLTPTNGASRIVAGAGDNGTGVGSFVLVGRNTNASAPAAGFLYLQPKTITFRRVWVDDSGLLRIHTVDPTNANDTAGTVVGAQTSSLDTKEVLGDAPNASDALAYIAEGARAVQQFSYRDGRYNGEEFSGVIVDYAPRYGMDRDKEHPAGKSLNVINALGDLMIAVDNLAQRVAVLEGA